MEHKQQSPETTNRQPEQVDVVDGVMSALGFDPVEGTTGLGLRQLGKDLAELERQQADSGLAEALREALRTTDQVSLTEAIEAARKLIKK